MKDYAKIYPCTITSDRYSGTYSGGKWLAWPVDACYVPSGANDSDLDCDYFWRNWEKPVGKGETPQDAYADLERQLAKDG